MWRLRMLLALAVLVPGMAGCSAPVPEQDCDGVRADLARAVAELKDGRAQMDEANAKLRQMKAELDKARADLARGRTAQLEQLLRERRSVRGYADAPLARDEVMKLLWAGQGITSPQGGRTAPSAGALYPLELYVVAGNVSDLAPGVYRYSPESNGLSQVKEGDVRASLAAACLGQSPVRSGAVDIVIAAVYERTAIKYGSRAERYVHLEAGHAAQNICLQAVALDLGLVTVGAFSDVAVKAIVGMSEGETPLYVLPVGRPQR